MAFRVFSLGAAVSVLAAGCAVPPRPQDMTGVTTNAIVRKIRCEAREGIKNAYIDFLVNERVTGIPKDVRQMARDIRAGRLSFSSFEPSRLGGAIARALNKYEAAAIAYDFEFDLTGENSTRIEFDLLGAVTHGALGVGLSAGNSHTRRSKRTFRIADNFGDLRRTKGCLDTIPDTVNFNYPITGDIGLEEVIKTFINLNELNGLTGTEETPAVPVFSNMLTFTTIVDAGATPKADLSPPLTRSLRLTELRAPLTAKRTDVHQVLVAISLDPAKVQPVAKASREPLRPLVARRSREDAANAKDNALREVENQKTLNTLSNIGRLR